MSLMPMWLTSTTLVPKRASFNGFEHIFNVKTLFDPYTLRLQLI